MNQVETLRVILNRLGDHSYSAGVNGTCFDCPFATAPLRSDGTVAEWPEVSNDPTEAYFRCSLPGRNPQEVVWGEYAPCAEAEWLNVALGLLGAYEAAQGVCEALLEHIGPLPLRLLAERDADPGYRFGFTLATPSWIKLLEAVRDWKSAQIGFTQEPSDG